MAWGLTPRLRSPTNAVVATGRNTDAVRTAVGEAEDLLVVHLDVTSPEDAEAAVKGLLTDSGASTC